MKDFYYILGVDADCTLIEIKEAYRKLSKKFHPDLNQGDKYFEDRFREINEAYETLINPIERSRYNTSLKNFKIYSSSREYQKRHYYKEQAENQRRREEEARFKQAYYQQGKYNPPGQRFQSGQSSINKPGTKRPGLGIAIALILVTCILGFYLFESFSKSKSNPIKKTAAITAVPVKIHKHHKNKRPVNNLITANFLKVTPDTAVKTPIKPAVVNKQPPVAIINKLPATITDPKTKDQNNDILYSTYVQPNVTGVINMRKLDNYSSAIVQVIPANAKVAVLGRGNVYYKVLYNANTGYVPKWSLQTK